MSQRKKDGGPAFPVDNPSGHDPGMSLRAWLAGQAMKGIVSGALARGNPPLGFLGGEAGSRDRLVIVKAAVALADDLIRELNG